jgi:aspartyl-tRNA(Asn)/glutamyl-tRNA(Gln) amidotransferase subunit C
MIATKEEVRHLGWLARMELSDNELERYTTQIEEIIKYLDTLDAIPLDDEEEAQPIIAKKKFSELRPDEQIKFEGDSFGTKYRKDGFVKGPRMV